MDVKEGQGYIMTMGWVPVPNIHIHHDMINTFTIPMC
jgi:hypothetical protein